MKSYNRILQIRLWENCSNNCSFCYLKNNRKILTQEERRSHLQLALNFLKEKGNLYSKIGLIGGEFFQGQLNGLLTEWKEVLDVLNNLNLKQIWIAATLTSENLDDLLFTLQYLDKSKTLICTSWDAEGRFSDISQKIWKRNIHLLHNLGYDINVTTILTQDLLEADQKGLFNIPKYCKVNICDPHLGLEWYNQVDKKNYHEDLIKKNILFRLPKRKDFLNFLKNHPDILKNYINYKNTHSDDVIDFDDRKIYYMDRCNNDNPLFINTCGHPYFSQCYQDSDKCAMCDAEALNI